MRNRGIDAVVLGASLFAAVALFGAAVTAFDSNRTSSTSRALVGSTAKPVAPVAAMAAPMDLASAQQALAPFVPADGHDHASLDPMLADGGHLHGELAAGDHAHDPSAPHDGHAPGAGHDHGGDVPNAIVIADGNSWKGGPFEGWRIQWEPAGANRGSAMRIINENDIVHSYSPDETACNGVTPAQSNLDYGAWLIARTHEALQPYRNRPDVALADGFVPYPLGNRYWHMINFSRLSTNSYVAAADPSVGNPDSAVLNPSQLESFIYGMVDGEGLVPIGGMYMYGVKDQAPPDPFGCVTAWHRHLGSQGLITSFDPTDPRSVWMVHVWDLSMIGPWGEHDGTHASEWWLGWRYLPNVCPNSDCL